MNRNFTSCISGGTPVDDLDKPQIKSRYNRTKSTTPCGNDRQLEHELKLKALRIASQQNMFEM